MAAEPSLRDASATSSLVIKLAVAGLLSLGVVTIVPRTVSSAGAIPPVGMMLATATIVAAICGVLLFWGLRSDLGLPATIAVYAVVFNALVIVVKLVLGPRGYYEVDQTQELDSTFAISDSLMAIVAATFVFALYAGAYLVLYRFSAGRLRTSRPTTDWRSVRAAATSSSRSSCSRSCSSRAAARSSSSCSR